MGTDGKIPLSEDSLGQILAENARDLRRYIEDHLPRRLSARCGAEDIMQEVWIAAFRSIDELGNISARRIPRWLKTTAQRKLIDAIKGDLRLKRGGADFKRRSSTRNGPGLGRNGSTVDGRTPSRIMAKKDVTDAVQTAILQLPEAQSIAIRHQLEGYSLTEIAQAMSKSESAVRSLIFRAIQTLCVVLPEASKFFSDC